MRYSLFPKLTALCALAALGACQPETDDSGSAGGDVAAGEPAPAPTPTANARPEADQADQQPVLSEEAAKGETGARALLLDWARALENGDFAAAYAALGRASSMSESEYADYWSGFGRLTVAVPEGQVEGAAGSLYYEVPATITGSGSDGETVRFAGPVVLRRVNDVSGASAAQLRWHFESADIVRQ